jgi:pimeloyl-ACP methyl ester carboxylesterase
MTAITVGRSYTVSYFDRPGSGPTILYIHGLGCSKADFIDMTFVPELKPFRLISADNPGCGDTSYDEKHPLNIDAVVELCACWKRRSSPPPIAGLHSELGKLSGDTRIAAPNS